MYYFFIDRRFGCVPANFVWLAAIFSAGGQPLFSSVRQTISAVCQPISSDIFLSGGQPLFRLPDSHFFGCRQASLQASRNFVWLADENIFGCQPAEISAGRQPRLPGSRKNGWPTDSSGLQTNSAAGQTIFFIVCVAQTCTIKNGVTTGYTFITTGHM